jgi:DAK2 domain fusion protein YloV
MTPQADHLDADGLRQVVAGFRDGLRSHQAVINRLNVYPVPDGDTGTNMALTVESVVNELESSGEGADLPTTCKAISQGSLMGARGNSGVILSQILRGVASTVEQAGHLDGPTLAAALATASEAAYGAVMKPVEGTILTVVREAAEGAAKVNGDRSLVEVAEAARSAGGDALDRTPTLLPVLAEAGVVDAGGAGFLLLLDAVLHVADGRPMPEPADADEIEVQIAIEQVHAQADGHGDIGDLRYEVMYFLEASDEAIPAFKHVWAGIGDSIVVVGGDGLWNCHIHTDDIGASIEAALDCGRPRSIRVTDLLEQVEEERWVREGGSEPVPDERPSLEPVTTAVVAVSNGDGVRRIFHSLGVQRIVTGGQSMNPSTAELLEAVEAAQADDVVILPNNKNIVPVAEQVQGQTSKRVRVVPTSGVAEGFAALMAYDPGATGDENEQEMREAADNVVAGEVTRAVRDSSCELGPIAAGDWLGISREGIRSVEKELWSATTGLLGALLREDHEIVTLIEGEGATAGETRRVTEWLAEHHPHVSCEVHHGGQPLYPYYVGIE